MSLSLEDELKFNRPQAVVKASDLLKNKNKNTARVKATVKKTLNRNSLKAAKSHNKNTAHATLKKSQASVRSKLLAEITNRVSKLSKKFKLRAQSEKNAIKLKLSKKGENDEEKNPALRADKCMTFQRIFFETDTKGKKTVKKSENGDPPADTTADGGDGELNEEEWGTFLTTLKADPLFAESTDVAFAACIEKNEAPIDAAQKGKDKDKLDTNGLIDIDEALKCYNLAGDNCKTNTNQLGELYSRRITSAVSLINDEIFNLKSKRTIIENHLEAVNEELRKLQDELDEDTAIQKTKETMNSVQLAMVNMRLNLNLAIKHDINNWVPNEEGGPVTNGPDNNNNQTTTTADGDDCPADKKSEAIAAAEAKKDTNGYTTPVTEAKIEGGVCVIKDSANNRFKNGDKL